VAYIDFPGSQPTQCDFWQGKSEGRHHQRASPVQCVKAEILTRLRGITVDVDDSMKATALKSFLDLVAQVFGAEGLV
jgi:hypothetical protein